MTRPGRNADPITMEVVRNALSSIADEMALVVLRTAYSSIVRDFDGLFDRPCATGTARRSPTA